MAASIIFGLSLLGLSGGLGWLHLRARRTSEAADSNNADREFARGQFRRRIQVCGLLAVVGGAIIAGAFVTNTLLASVFWLGVTLLVVWMGWLALADWKGSRAHFGTLHAEQTEEHAALRAELAKYLPETNGQRPKDHS